MERLLTPNVRVSYGNYNSQTEKSSFAVNFPLKPLRATVANVETGCPKSLHTLFDTYFDHMLAKFDPK